MADLFNQQISATYSGLLKTSSSGVLSASLSQISDGRGNTSPLYLSTGSIQFYGAYSFPNADGSANQVLKTDGAGVLTWENDSLSNTLDFSGGTGTGSVTLDTQVLAFTGTANEIVTSASSQAITLSFPTAGVTLPDGSIATTQTASDNSTKVATTAYVDNQVSTAGTVTSVALSVPTGLTVTGSPITTSGTITIGGTLSVANGGTGATTLTGILVGNGTSAISAVTDGTVGKVLSTNANGTYSFIDAAGGDVTKTGTITANQIAVWNDSTDELRSDETVTVGTDHSITLLQKNSLGTDLNTYNIGGGNITNATGLYNTGFGKDNLNAITTGGANVAIGKDSLKANTGGNSNVAIGVQSLYQSTGGYSIAIGYQSLYSNTTTGQNVAIGHRAMYTSTIGYNNVAIGHNALYINTEGYNNTALGHNSGNAITTGSNNVIIGSNTGSTIATSNNNIIISDGSGNIRQSFDINGAATFSNSVQTYRLKLIDAASSTNFTLYTGVDNANSIGFYNETTSVYDFKIGSTGAATFSSSVTATGGYLGGGLSITTDGTASNSPSATSANIGVLNSTYAFIDLSTAAVEGGWIDFSKGDGSDYSGRIRYENSSDALQFFTNAVLTPRLTISSGGQVIVGGTSYSGISGVDGGFEIEGDSAQFLLNNPNFNHFTMYSAADSNIYNIFGDTGDYLIGTGDKDTSSFSEKMRIQSSGNVIFLRTTFSSIQAVGCYTDTTASAANMHILSSGSVVRSTSSRKYKKNIQDSTHGINELLKLRSVTYQGTGNHDGKQVLGGLIAEEVHDLGLTEFVQYAEDGTPDALAYGHMVSLCVKSIQEQQTIIEDLKARIETLEG